MGYGGQPQRVTVSSRTRTTLAECFAQWHSELLQNAVKDHATEYSGRWFRHHTFEYNSCEEAASP